MAEEKSKRGRDGKFAKKATGNNDGISEGRKRSLANLKPFPKGVSGNPKGRPRETILPHLREIAAQEYPGGDGRTYGEMIARSLFEQALTDIHACRELLDRLDGRTSIKFQGSVDVRDDANLRDEAKGIYAEILSAVGDDEERARELMAEWAPTLSNYVH